MDFPLSGWVLGFGTKYFRSVRPARVVRRIPRISGVYRFDGAKGYYSPGL